MSTTLTHPQRLVRDAELLAAENSDLHAEIADLRDRLKRYEAQPEEAAE